MSDRKITVENTRQTTISVTDYHDRVLALLEHIEKVSDTETWKRIDAELWNAVTLAEPEVVYSE